MEDSGLRERGIVKFYEETKGYGFITPDSGKKDIFFHRSNIESMNGTVEKGERVEFEVTSGAKGPEAKHVNLIEQ